MSELEIFAWGVFLFGASLVTPVAIAVMVTRWWQGWLGRVWYAFVRQHVLDDTPASRRGGKRG